MAFKNPLGTYFPEVDFFAVKEHIAVLGRSQRKIKGLGKWIADLRSGEYEQAKDQLHDDGRDCCLSVYGRGLGCAVVGSKLRMPNGIMLDGILSYQRRVKAPGWADKTVFAYLPEALQNVLSVANDKGGTYEQIAHFLESECVEKI